MPKRLKQTVSFDDLDAIWQELVNESDRGMALVGASLLDDHLMRLLRSFLVSDTKVVEEFLTAERAPLRDFGARIKAAYCLGLISKEEYDDFETARVIRNGFAHQLGHTFDSPAIVELFKNVKTFAPESLPRSTMGRRRIFLQLVLSLVGASNERFERWPIMRRVVPPLPKASTPPDEP